MDVVDYLLKHKADTSAQDVHMHVLQFMPQPRVTCNFLIIGVHDIFDVGGSKRPCQCGLLSP